MLKNPCKAAAATAAEPITPTKENTVNTDSGTVLQPVPMEHLSTRYAEHEGSLLDLDALLGKLVTTVQEQCDDGRFASDEMGNEEVKAIQAHVRQMVLAEKRALAPPAPSPERLLEIARATGLREVMHGVPPSVVRPLLAAFFEAASRPESDAIPPAPKVDGIREDPPAADGTKWMRLMWWADEKRRMDNRMAWIRQDLLHEEQAQRNHGQTLDGLRQRGGLCPTEALAIIRRVPYRPSINEAEAFAALLLQVQRLEGAST